MTPNMTYTDLTSMFLTVAAFHLSCGPIKNLGGKARVFTSDKSPIACKSCGKHTIINHLQQYQLPKLWI